MAKINMSTTHLPLRITLGIASAFIGILALFALLIVSLFYSTILSHDFTMWKLKQSLTFLVQHPKTSTLMEQKTFFGSRYTDISECTYAVGEIRATPLAQEHILQIYAHDMFRFIRNTPAQILIITKDTSLPLDHPADKWIVNFQEYIKQERSSLTYYLVYFYEPDHPWWGDFRCYD